MRQGPQGQENIPRGLKPVDFDSLMYGLKPVPFKG